MRLSEARRKLLPRLRRRKSREREGLFLVEGVRATGEALAGNAALVFAVVSPRLRELEGGAALEGRLRAATDLCEADDDALSELSATESPQGVLVVCKEPVLSLTDLESGGPPRRGVAPAVLRLLVVDGIQDPGNLGTLIRAAAGFALAGVVVLEGSVDPYNPKAVRAAAGALFRMPLVRADWDTTGAWLAARGVRVLVGDPGGEDVGRVPREPPWALVVGSEGAGPRPAVRLAASERVAVPMPGGTESLNAGVAGAVLLYALTREASRG